MQKQTKEQELLNKEIEEQINKHLNNKQYAFTYDHVAKQGVGCLSEEKTNEPRIFFMVKKNKVLRYHRSGMITEEALGQSLGQSNPLSYEEPLNLDLKNPLRFQLANLKLLELLEAMILQVNVFATRERITLSFLEELQKKKKRQRKPKINQTQEADQSS